MTGATTMARQTTFAQQAFFTVVLAFIAGAGVASLLSFVVRVA